MLLSRLGERHVLSFEQIWNPLPPRILVAKSGWNCPSDSEEEYFKISSMFFRYFVIISLRNGRGIYFKKLESPSRKNALCQILMKLAQWFWRRFLNFINVFLPFHNYPFLEKFEQTWIPFTQGYFVTSLVEFGPVVLEEKIWKVYIRGQTTDNRLSEKLIRAFSSGEQKTLNKHPFIHCNIRYRYMLLQSTKHVYTGFEASQIVFNIFSRQRKKIAPFFTQWKSSDHKLDPRTKSCLETDGQTNGTRQWHGDSS